jgi:ribosomal protein RSM22 (predicted rRNA methylase)
MRLPAPLLAAIERELAAFSAADLTRAAAQITERYHRAGHSTPALTTAAQHAAYLAVRMPATYAAGRMALQRLREQAPGYAPSSLLDLGAGPGTALWAAADTFPSLASATLIDSDPLWAQIGQRLAEAGGHPVFSCADRRVAGLEPLGAEDAADLVMVSYAMGEIPRGALDAALRAAWKATGGVLVILEPGTPQAFPGLLAARDLLLAAGAHLLAPCPQAGRCPMSGTPDWCHFPARVERTSLHRRLKGGRLGHEDEKFSYLIFCREAAAAAKSRIVRHPRVHGGHIELELCARAGLRRETVTRSRKEAFRRARRSQWGDAWPDPA